MENRRKTLIAATSPSAAPNRARSCITLDLIRAALLLTRALFPIYLILRRSSFFPVQRLGASIAGPWLSGRDPTGRGSYLPWHQSCSEVVAHALSVRFLRDAVLFKKGIQKNMKARIALLFVLMGLNATVGEAAPQEADEKVAALACIEACPAPQWVTIGTFADALPHLAPEMCEYRIHNTNVAGGGHYLLPTSLKNGAIRDGSGNLLKFTILKFSLDLADMTYASFIDTSKFRDAATFYKNNASLLKDINFEARTGYAQWVGYSVDYADENNLIQGMGYGIVNNSVKSHLILQERCS